MLLVPQADPRQLSPSAVWEQYIPDRVGRAERQAIFHMALHKHNMLVNLNKWIYLVNDKVFKAIWFKLFKYILAKIQFWINISYIYEFLMILMYLYLNKAYQMRQREIAMMSQWHSCSHVLLRWTIFLHLFQDIATLEKLLITLPRQLMLGWYDTGTMFEIHQALF